MDVKRSRRVRLEDDDTGDNAGGLGGVALLPAVSDDDVHSLREIARNGGGKNFVAPKTVTASQIEHLRIEGLVETGPAIKGVGGKLTARGLQALAASPAAARL